MGLIEAYVTNPNRVVGQIFAYTTYTKGCNRGKGPTIFELAFWNVDIIGSPHAFLNASNMVLSQSMKYGFHSSDALHGDLKTTSVKRKSPTMGNVSLQDSHRHDKVLVTGAMGCVFPSCNLETKEFVTLVVKNPFVVGLPMQTTTILLSDSEVTNFQKVTRTFFTSPKRIVVSPPPIEVTPTLP